MKEKRHRDKHHKKHKRCKDAKHKKRTYSSSSSSSAKSEEWVEKSTDKQSHEREDWMSMTGMLKTYTNNDIKPKKEETHKKNIDSYNPATNIRELNPYWKDGGSGLPQTSEKNYK